VHFVCPCFDLVGDAVSNFDRLFSSLVAAVGVEAYFAA
jgi:hypothetical protein